MDRYFKKSVLANKLKLVKSGFYVRMSRTEGIRLSDYIRSSSKVLNTEEFKKGEEKFVMNDMALRLVDQRDGFVAFDHPTKYSLKNEKM